MKRILFVDDDPKILGGLRRMLRGLRHDWEMEFVESGPEALDRLAAAHFDVVVTDMRMPGMDGSQLLSEARQRYSATVRMILSGQCERESVLKCVGPTHQFLTKPCDSEVLKSTIARACRLRDHLPDEWIKQAVSSIQSIPSRRSVYAGLQAELESPRASIHRVGEIISRDVGMTAKVMQLVSSGFFGTPQRVSEVAQAASFLGLETIGALLHSAGVFVPVAPESEKEHFWEVLGDHSLSVATAAKELAAAETDDATFIGDAYLSGLLHDVGTLVLAKDSPEQDLQSLASSRLQRMVLNQAEERTVNTTRDDVGAYLMGLWGLPDPIVRAIAYHLRPARSSDTTFSPLTVVHVANAVMEEDLAGLLGVPTRIDTDYLQRIGCANRLDTWCEICRATRSEGVPQ